MVPVIGPLMTSKPGDRPARSVAVQLPAPESDGPHLRVWAGGVRLHGTCLAVVPGRTTTDPAVLREHAAAVLAVAFEMERGGA